MTRLFGGGAGKSLGRRRPFGPRAATGRGSLPTQFDAGLSAPVDGTAPILAGLTDAATYTAASTMTVYTLAPSYSQELEGTVWDEFQTLATVSAEPTPYGDGSMARKLMDTINSAQHFINHNGTLSITTGDVREVFFDLKAAEESWAQIKFNYVFGNAWANFNLATGVVGLSGNGAVADILALGGGWYRCFLRATATATLATTVLGYLHLTNNANAAAAEPVYVGTGAKGIYVAGWMPVVGSTHRPYQRVQAPGVVTQPAISGVQAAAAEAPAAYGGALSVSTSEDNGTLYWAVTTSATPPTAAAIQLGTGFAWAGSRAVTASGAQAATATGLASGTTYYAHAVHKDAAGNVSGVVSGDGFTTEFTGATATHWRLRIRRGQAHNTYVNVSAVEFRTSAGVAKQATGGTSFGSAGVAGDKGPAAAFDNNATTYFQNNASLTSTDAIVGYVFPSAIEVKEVAVQHMSTFTIQYAPGDFYVEYSLDAGTTWLEAWHVDSNVVSPWTTPGETKLFTRPPLGTGTFRYWRLCEFSTGNGYFSCAEMEMRLTPGGADQCGTTGGFGGVVMQASYPIARAFDNNAANFALTEGVYPGKNSMGYDFGAGQAKAITQIAYSKRPDSFGANEAILSGRVEGSADGLAWFRQWDVPAQAAWGNAAETRLFTKP